MIEPDNNRFKTLGKQLFEQMSVLTTLTTLTAQEKKMKAEAITPTTHPELYGAVRWYIDGGHSWLRVPISLIKPEFGRYVTEYSYIDDEYFYLEADDDATNWLSGIQPHWQGIGSIPISDMTGVAEGLKFSAKTGARRYDSKEMLDLYGIFGEEITLMLPDGRLSYQGRQLVTAAQAAIEELILSAEGKKARVNLVEAQYLLLGALTSVIGTLRVTRRLEE